MYKQVKAAMINDLVYYICIVFFHTYFNYIATYGSGYAMQVHRKVFLNMYEHSKLFKLRKGEQIWIHKS